MLPATWVHMIAFRRDCCLALIIFSPASGKLGFRDSEWCTHFFSCQQNTQLHLENKQTKESKGEEKNSHGVGTCDYF